MSLGERSLGSCPTCGKDALLTKEHVYPGWLLREIGEGYEAAILDICSPCNASLGRIFEAKASRLMKPMLRGHPVSLTVRSQKLLAGWLCKTAVLLVLREYQEPTLTDSTRLDQRADAVDLVRVIMKRKGPPPGAYVRISQYDGLEAHDAAGFRPPNPPATSFYAMGVLSNIVSEVLVKKNGTDIDEVLAAYDAARKEAGNDAWSMRIWPRPEPATWPPLNTLGPRELVEVERFQTLALRAARGDHHPLPPLQDRVLRLRERRGGHQDVPGDGSAADPGA